jgi:hypothetical protein
LGTALGAIFGGGKEPSSERLPAAEYVPTEDSARKTKADGREE